MEWLRPGERHLATPAERTHLVGLGRPGMSGLAQMLVQRGATVTGSATSTNPAVERLRRMGVRLHAGHPTRLCPDGVQLLVYSPGIGSEHPERLSAARRGIAQASATDWLSGLVRDSVGLVVAGQREAGVASAMIAWTLARAGFDPSVLLANPVPQLGGWARLGVGPHFVVEAVDEPEGFGPLAPRIAVILNVSRAEGGDPAGRQAALRRFTTSVPVDGHILALEPNNIIEDAVSGLETRVEGISLDRGSTWWGADLREERGRYRFRAFHRGRFAVEVRLQIPGRRNVLSALAAVAACGHLDIPAPEIKQGLEEFEGRTRDFESRGSYRGVTLVDDDGQDPSTVAEVLAIGREVYSGRRLWAVYGCEPGVGLCDDAERMAVALAAADHVVIIQGVADGPRGSTAESLADSLVAAGRRAWRAHDLDEAIRGLDRQLEPGDVLVTLGAGDVGTIADAFIRRLSRDRQSR
jgi:UDP-N-acetylmuramate--alanine ligase